jgi:hypothetical protein
MTLLSTWIGAFLIKLLTQIPFSWRRWRVWTGVAMGSTLVWAPLLTILYHETDVDFEWMFLLHLVLEGLFLWRLVGLRGWQAVLATSLNTLLFFLYFLIGNG